MATPSPTHHQIRNISTIIVTDTRRAAPTGGSNNDTNFAAPLNYSSIANADAQLTTLLPGSFTAARLTQMTLNDKIYALRLHSGGTTGI